jgi:hypothetical protein
MQKRVEHYRAKKNDMCEAIEELEDFDKLGQGFTSPDPLEEMDIGDGVTPSPIFVKRNFDEDYKANLIKLLKEYADCFAWNYQEMPDLSRHLIEHQLSIKASFRQYEQNARHYNPPMYDQIKDDIDQLLKANFIRPCWYVSNGFPALCRQRKRALVRLERALILEISIELLIKMSILCLLSICLLMMLQDIELLVFLMVMLIIIKKNLAKEDIYKMTFRCPRFVGFFEWIVMILV